MVVDVAIEKIHVSSFCHDGNAAAELLFSPIWPWLNGELQTISCGSVTIDLCRLIMGFTTSDSATSVVQDEVATEIFNTIVNARQASAIPSQQRWQVGPADRIWRSRQEVFDNLATSGIWALAEPWGAVAHENLHSLLDQLDCQQSIAGPTSNPETAATITAHLTLFLFTSTTIYLNIAYTKHCNNLLELSEFQLMRRAASCLDSIRYYLSNAADATADKIYV